MTVYPIKATFSRGELSPRLHGRVDIDHYKMGLEICTNFYVLRQGGLRRRPGTVFVSEIKDSTEQARLIPFEFNETQAYVVELGDLYCRFYALTGQVEFGGSPYEISHSYLEADLFDIHYEQSADVLYLAHGDYFPQTLTRTSETDWAVNDFEAEDGPYLDEVSDGTSLMLDGTGAVHPIMTSNSTPAGWTAASSNSSSGAWYAFDSSAELGIDLGSIAGAWLGITLDAAKVVDGYSLRATRIYPDRHPMTWSFQGYDGATWVTLDYIENEIGWDRSETRHFYFENTKSFIQYRIYVHATSDNNNAQIASFILHWQQSDQTGITLTASAVTGINSGSGFISSDINRSIRLYGTDGLWRWAKITGVNSTTAVDVTIGDQAFLDLNPIYRWKMSAWDEINGYPQTVGFFNERLTWAGTAAYPRTVWFSESANYNGYRLSSPVVDSDTITVSMTGGKINKIQFVKDIYDLAVGTTQTIRTVGAASSSSPFALGNVEQKPQTTEGSSNIQPITVGETTIYVDYYKQRIREFTYSFELNGYQAPELSVLSDHIYRSGITSISYQSVPDNLIWIGLANGRMGCTTFEKNQSIVGMVQMFIAGGSADTDGEAVVESHCTVPTESGDRLWMVVKRTINGVTKRYVEYLADPFEEDDVEDGVFFDSSVTATGTDFTTISGLDHLEGELIGVLADGVDIGDATVASGQITLPGGVTADKAIVGLRYQSYGKTLRMAEAGNQDGTAMGRRKIVNEIYLDAYEVGAMQVGTTTRQFEMFERKMTETFGGVKSLFTGFEKIKTEGKWSGDGQVVFHTDRGYPATIRALVAGIDGEP
ncbi:MAG: hypothetical protein GY749_22735 [Desulfobacteraceae bacterium]|nr:hypothetical protein [Desulfobacteraceae bacterium]